MFHARRPAGTAHTVAPEARALSSGGADEPKPEGPASERGIYLLVIQGTMAASPIFQQIVSRFSLRAYVLMGAVGENVCGRSGELIVEFVGPPQAVDDAVNWLEERGARIERLGAA